jgi:hypothetical protein
MAETIVRDEMLFHDLAALAARVEDEGGRLRALMFDPDVKPEVAHAAGIAYAKLDTLESLMFDATNSIHHLASEVALASTSVSSRWLETKEACRDARLEARRLTDRRLAAAAVSG